MVFEVENIVCMDPLSLAFLIFLDLHMGTNIIGHKCLKKNKKKQVN